MQAKDYESRSTRCLTTYHVHIDRCRYDQMLCGPGSGGAAQSTSETRMVTSSFDGKHIDAIQFSSRSGLLAQEASLFTAQAQPDEV